MRHLASVRQLSNWVYGAPSAILGYVVSFAIYTQTIYGHRKSANHVLNSFSYILKNVYKMVTHWVG